MVSPRTDLKVTESLIPLAKVKISVYRIRKDSCKAKRPAQLHLPNLVKTRRLDQIQSLPIAFGPLQESSKA